MNELLPLVIVLSPFALFGSAWVCSTAFFKAKLAYQRQLIRELNPPKLNQRGDLT